MTIHKVGRTTKYPVGIKYGLILIDIKTSKKVLMDNHHPKGPHIHLNEREMPYNFENEDKLIQDFKTLVFENMGVKI